MKILCFNGRFCNHIVRFSKVYHLRFKSISFTTQKYVIYGSKVCHLRLVSMVFIEMCCCVCGRYDILGGYEVFCR